MATAELHLPTDITDIGTEIGKMSHAVGVGGLGSFKNQWPGYKHLMGGSESPLHVSKHFLAIPDHGLSPVEEMYGELEENFLEVHDHLESKVTLFGHSLGGFMVTRLGIDHPDKISNVVAVAGVQEGVKSITPSGQILKFLLNNPPGEEHIMHESDFIQSHLQRVKTEWDPDVNLHLISPTYDTLIPAPQGLGLEVPDGQSIEKHMIAPNFPGLRRMLRHRYRLPEDVGFLDNPWAVGHVDIAFSLGLFNYMKQIRRDSPESDVEAIASSRLEAVAA